MSDIKYFVIGNDDCRYSSMTTEQIVDAIAEATGNVPKNIDDAVISKIKEQNRSGSLKFWIGTQAEYNAITPEANVFYIFTDSDEMSDIEQIAENTATAVVNERMLHFNKSLLSSSITPIENQVTTASVPGISNYKILIIDGELFVRSSNTRIYHSSTHCSIMDSMNTVKIEYSNKFYDIDPNNDTISIWYGVEGVNSVLTATNTYNISNGTQTWSYQKRGLPIFEIIGIC